MQNIARKLNQAEKYESENKRKRAHKAGMARTVRPNKTKLHSENSVKCKNASEAARSTRQLRTSKKGQLNQVE